MFRPKTAIIGCLKSSSYKETAVFVFIIGINLLIVRCMFVANCLPTMQLGDYMVPPSYVASQNSDHAVLAVEVTVQRK
jgi:hypothetical protein